MIIKECNFRMSHNIKINMYYFSGNTLHNFMNENWKALTQEFAVPMLEQPLNKMFTTMKTYLRSQPLEDIAVV